jgi:hypothetical protein
MPSMPYMPPAAIEEALARMRGESEDTTEAARAMRTHQPITHRSNVAAAAAMQPQVPPPPAPPPMLAPAQMFHALRGRLIQRGMAPADAARAAAAALRRRTGTTPTGR